MKEKLLDLRLWVFDLTGAAIAGVTIEKLMGEALHWFISVSAAVVAGSLLFVLQKTLLPKISNWINKKMDLWLK